MQVTINGAPCPLNDQEVKSYGEAMKWLGQYLSREGKVIVRVRLNDQDLTGAFGDDLYDRPVTEIETLKIDADYPEKLAIGTLQTTDQWVERLAYEIEKSADLMRLGEEVEANTALTNFIDGFQILLLALKKIDVILQQATNTTVSELETFRKQFLETLDQILEAQSRQDWILLADLLEYELLSVLSGWPEVSARTAEALRLNLETS